MHTCSSAIFVTVIGRYDWPDCCREKGPNVLSSTTHRNVTLALICNSMTDNSKIAIKCTWYFRILEYQQIIILAECIRLGSCLLYTIPIINVTLLIYNVSKFIFCSQFHSGFVSLFLPVGTNLKDHQHWSYWTHHLLVSHTKYASLCSLAIILCVFYVHNKTVLCKCYIFSVYVYCKCTFARIQLPVRKVQLFGSQRGRRGGGYGVMYSRISVLY